MSAPDAPDVTDPYAGQVVLLTRRLLEDDDLDPGFVAFEPDDVGHPVGEDRAASGWELYVGDETDAELEDPDNARLTDLSWALDRFPSIRALVAEHDERLPGAWLSTLDDGWVEVTDEDADGPA